MSYGAGHIMDMINRMKQNREQRPSQRRKFRKNHDSTLINSHKETQKPHLKTIPEKELIAIKQQIREKLKKENRKSIIFTLTIVVLFILFFILIIYLLQ